MSTFRPLYDRVLVKRVESDTQSAGGLFIPESAKEKPQTAKVISVGTGRVKKDGTLAPLAVKAGDEILLNKWGGDEIKIDGIDHLILKESDILAVIEN
jgi:chaperonin GroES